MKTVATLFNGREQNSFFNADLNVLESLFEKEKIIIITDENVFTLHAKKFEGYKSISIDAGEHTKTQKTVDGIIAKLLSLDADKTTIIVGVGGGVVTDIAGYVSSIYKRGVPLILVPTTILAMTDAAIGGKNGVNVGQYKNMVGTTRQAECLIFDYRFLDTLPQEEWISGFAEIIKHACIKDAAMFAELERTSLEIYQSNREMIASLIEKNAALKTAVVVNDEHETGERYLLNFGHTFGHAIEKLHGLSHGNAVSLGMVIAAKFSQRINGFPDADLKRLAALLAKYHLPVEMQTENDKITALLKKDKKRGP